MAFYTWLRNSTPGDATGRVDFPSGHSIDRGSWADLTPEELQAMLARGFVMVEGQSPEASPPGALSASNDIITKVELDAALQLVVTDADLDQAITDSPATAQTKARSLALSYIFGG